MAKAISNPRTLLRTGALALAVGAAGAGALLSPPAGAQPTAVAISSLCSQMPGLLAAVDWSQKTWPPERNNIPTQTTDKLSYFRLLVAADTTWCAINNAQDQPESVLNSMLWHFGNASLALQEYQAAGRQGAPADTPPPPAPPTATPPATPASPATPAATPPAAPAPTPAPTAAAPVFTGTRAPVLRAASPGAPQAVLTNVRIGSHDGFDRVVFDFRGAIPGYRIEYVQPPIRYDASGSTAAVAGSAFLRVRFQPASGFDQAAGQAAYNGPAELSPALPALLEAEQTGDFEAMLTWVLGLQQAADFRVLELEGPFRLVVDVAHPPR